MSSPAESAAVATRAPPGPVDVVLRDGTTAEVRVAVGADEDAVTEFLTRLSPDSLYYRFFCSGVDLRASARRTVAPRPGAQTLLATRGADGTVIGIGELSPVDATHAEMAFAVADEMHGRGVATILLAHLAEVAHAAGVSTLQAEVLPANVEMRDVFRGSGLRFVARRTGPTLLYEAPTAPTTEALARFEERASEATAHAVAHFLEPRSVAVVGASRRPDAVGARVLANLVGGGYGGRMHPVNPQAVTLQGLPASATLAAIDAPVDLVVVAVPAAVVVDVAEEAADRGANALLVLSAGFAESGDEGTRRQADLLAICRRAGMRLVGPNSLGVLNSHGEVRLNATFAASLPPPGRVALVSQSGAVGIALLERAESLGIGVSSFASVGNRADLTPNDFLRYWELDDETAVVLLYVESFGDPRDFARVAGRLARRKPIVALKSGRTPVGARAAGSHTGALVAASDVTVDALFRQAGVIRAETVGEFLDIAALLERQPLPRGDRVAIVTNAGGPGVMCADACVAGDLTVPATPVEAEAELRRVLPPAAATGNPVDMLASADPEAYARTVAAVARGDWADAIVVIYVRVAEGPSAEFRTAVREAIAEVPDPPPVIWVQMSPESDAGDTSLPTYAFPEDAARALALVAEYGRWRRHEPAPFVTPAGARPEAAARLLADVVGSEPHWLEPDVVASLCACWGIPLVTSRVVADAAGVAVAARELGTPVAVKALGPELVHKTEAGAVSLGVEPHAAEREAAAMAARLAAAGVAADGFLVQPMVDVSVEMLVGVTSDPSFGPVVVCGTGGVRAELERDVAVRLAPVRPDDAREALRTLRVFPLLEGWRGAPRCDIAALEDIVVRTGALAESHPEVRELDFNPVAVGPSGAVVLDARVRVSRAPPPEPWPAIGASPPRVRTA